MVIRLGRNGRFLACSMYPEHKETRPLPGRGAAAPGGRRRGLPEVRRGDARRPAAAGSGRSSAARAIPDCDYIKREGPPPPEPLPFEVDCPKNADGHLVPRRARRTGNVFWGCSNYPKCDFTTNNEPLGGLHDADDGPLARKGEAAHLPEVRRDERARARRHRRRASSYPGGRPIPRPWRDRRAAGGGGRRGGRPRGGAARRWPRLAPHDASAPSRPPRRDARSRATASDRPAPSTGSSASLAARDASPHTIRAYATAVGAYLDWLAERGVDWRARPAGAARLPRAARRGGARDRRRPAARRDPLLPPLRGTRGARCRRPVGRDRDAAPAAPAAAGPRGRPGRAAARGRRGGPRGGRGRPARRDRPRHRPRAPRPGARRDRLRGRPADQRAGRRRPRVARPAARRDPGPRQGPQGADRAARAAGDRARWTAYLDDGRPLLAERRRVGAPAPTVGVPEPRRRRRSASAACATGSTACAARPGCRRASRRTPCATRSRPTCSTAARTCGSSRSCSATRASPRPRSTPTSRRPACAAAYRDAHPRARRADTARDHRPHAGPGRPDRLGAPSSSRASSAGSGSSSSPTRSADPAELDAFFAAFRIPDLLFQLVAAGALSSALIPVVAGAAGVRRRAARAWRVVSTVTNLMLVALLVLAGLVLRVRDRLVPLFTPRLRPGDDGARPSS